jgi:rod shape-determining protein MreC
MKKWLLVSIITICAYAVLSGEFLIEGKGAVLGLVRESLSGNGEIEYLREKNQELEIELLNLKKGNLDINFTENSVSAKVYSAYPFADRSELIINVGENKEIKPGMAVVRNNALIGKIKDVKKRTSVVQTVFDQEFQIPVRIGEEEIDALYVGGMNPKLNLIDSNKDICQGKMIVSSASGIPYGLGIGYTIKIKEGVLKEASVEPLFELKDIKNVSIITD